MASISFKYKEVIYYPLLKQMASYLPEGDFYNKQFDILPYDYKGNYFILNSSYSGQNHNIYVNDVKFLTFIPEENVDTTILLKLPQGINTIEITVESQESRDFIYIDNTNDIHPVPDKPKPYDEVNETTVFREMYNVSLYAAIYMAIIKEMQWAWIDLVTTTHTINSRLHLNLFETKLPSDIIRTFQKDSTRFLALRHLLYSKRHILSEKGLEEYVAATMGTRPYTNDMENKTEIELDSTIIHRSNDTSSGKDIHVWENTGCGTRRDLCFRVMNNLKHNWEITDESDYFIEFKENGSGGL